MSETKEFKKFNNNINSLLTNLAGAASWSDLLPVFKEMFKLVKTQTKNFNYSLIKEKITLSKRLAQSLSPECPGGVHEVVIEIYNIIIQNILEKNNGKLGDNLGLYCSGLFPFFSYASKVNKELFIEKLLNSCFLNLEEDELSLCLPGLLSSLILGLDDNNEKITTNIYYFFNIIRKKLKRGVFFGTYWSLLLRNKTLRPSGIKFLNDKIIKYNDYTQLNDKKKQETLEDEFPDVNNLVVNSISQLIEEQDIPTVRTSMDFIIGRFPLTKENTILSEKAKVNLITSTLKLLIKNEYSTTRRLSNWLLGISNIDEVSNYEEPDIIYKMDLIVEAFKNMFNSQKLINSEKLENDVQILGKLFAQLTEIPDFVLPKIAYDLILCYVNFWQTELNSSENVSKNKTIVILQRFFNKDNIECLYKSIANYLESTHERKDLNFEKLDYSSEKSIEKFIFQIIQPLKFCYLFLDLQSNEERAKYYIPIINNLLKIMNKLVFQKREQIQKVRHILFTILVITKSLQEKSLQNNINPNQSEEGETSKLHNRKKTFSLDEEENDENKKEENKEIYNISEESSLKNILLKANNEKNESIIKMMSTLNETIENYKKFYIKLLNAFLNFNQNQQITKNEKTIFKNSTELMIRLQEYVQSEDIPEWLYYIEKLIFKKGGNTELSLEAANSLLDLNLSSFKEHEIYLKIKNNFIEEKNDNVLAEIIDKETLDTIIKKIGAKKNCQELLMGKLLLILDDQSNQRMIISLLVKLSKYNMNKFINIIENTFTFEETLEDSVKIFSDFWQILNEYYPDYIIFEKGECLLEMLDYLDCDRPLLRHLSKSWLDQNYKNFDKIVNPILISLLEPNMKEDEKTNFIYFENEDDIKKLLNGFRRLKSLILNSHIMHFLILNNPNEKVLKLFNEKNTISLENLKQNYLSILIAFSLKLTRCKKENELKKSLKISNTSVNYSSCEFLEFLLSHINSAEIVMSYADTINIPILLLINEAIEMKNEVLQIQLLSVLRVLYFKTSSVHLKNKKSTLKLFSDEHLINYLTKGMTQDIYFVRESYINFTREFLPCFKKLIDDEADKDQYYSFGSNFISALTKYLSKRIYIDTKGREDTERFSHFDETSNCNYFIYKNYLDEYKEYKLYDDQDIILLLKGIRDLSSDFLNPNEIKSKTDFWPEFKNNLVESQRVPSGFLFGFFAGETDKKNDLDANVKKFFSSQIMNFLQSFLLTWINQSQKYEPYDYCLNVNGILPLKKVNKDIFPEEVMKEGMESIKKDSVKSIVRDLSFILFITNPIEFLEAIIDIWCSNIKKDELFLNNIGKDAQYKLTIIEYLIDLEIPLNIILYCLNLIIQKRIKLEKEEEKTKNIIKYQKAPKLKTFVTPYSAGVFEAKLIHLIYSYIELNPFYKIPLIKYNNDPIRTEICESWREMISLLNTLISDTKIIYTYCWLYELFALSLEKLELDKVFDLTMKTKLVELFNTITGKLINCVFNNKTDSTHVSEGKFILPYLPHIYLNTVNEVFPKSLTYLYNRYFESGQNINEEKASYDTTNKTESQKFELLQSTENKSKIADFYSLYYSSTKLITERIELSATPSSDAEFLNRYYRYITCITLKENFYKILNHIHGDANLFKKDLTDIIRQLLNFLKLNSQDNREERMFYAEFASDFLTSLMISCPEMTTSCGKLMFMEYLNDPSFFITTPMILSNWRKLISASVTYYPEILTDLISTTSKRFPFLNVNDEDKIKTLRRISFVIYSCQKDAFQKDFDNIKNTAKIFLTGNKNNTKLEIEIFLMMRVLFLRFSHDSVLKMIKDIWPIIFTELIINFKNNKRNANNKLLIESFKFIELLSLANEEEFSFYQWVFLLDTFNMKDLDTTNENSLLSKLLKKENKLFKPIAIDVISDTINKEETPGTPSNDELIKRKNVGKSELVIVPKGEELEDLQEVVKKLFYSIGDMNAFKAELNYDQIEDVIEKDFLDDGIIKK